MAPTLWHRFRGGFWDFVRLPGFRFRREADEATLRERLTPTGEPSAKEIRRLVQLLRDKQQRYVARDILREIGAPAVPELIAALRSDRFWPADDSDYFYSPFAIALWLLDDVAPPELLAVLRPRLFSEHASIRKSAARHIANLGLEDSIEALHEATQRFGLVPDVILGIKSCLERGGGTARFRDAMFQPVVEAVGDESSAPEVLLSLDREKAAAILLADEYFRLENQALHHIMDALGGKKVALPRDKLLRFVETLRNDHDGYPKEYHYGSCLEALALAKDECAGPLLQEAIKDSNKTVRIAACSAILWLHDIRDPHAPFAKRWEVEGLESLTQPQKVYVVVDRLYAEVSNGGFAQYFANSAGNQARYAVESHRTIGANETAETIARAVSLFGPDGPSPDRDTRSYQLSRMRDDDFALMSKLDTKYYDNSGRVESLLTMYVLKNEDHFREPAAASETR